MAAGPESSREESPTPPPVQVPKSESANPPPVAKSPSGYWAAIQGCVIRFARLAGASTRLAGREAAQLRLKNVDLPRAYTQLGEHVYQERKYADDFVDAFRRLNEVRDRIAELQPAESDAHSAGAANAAETSGSQPPTESKAAGLARKVRDAAQLRSLNAQRGRLYRQLGIQAHDKYGPQCAPQELAEQLARLLEGVGAAREEIARINSEEASGWLTPRRFLIGAATACVLLVVAAFTFTRPAEESASQPSLASSSSGNSGAWWSWGGSSTSTRVPEEIRELGGVWAQGDPMEREGPYLSVVEHLEQEIEKQNTGPSQQRKPNFDRTPEEKRLGWEYDGPQVRFYWQKDWLTARLVYGERGYWLVGAKRWGPHIDKWIARSTFYTKEDVLAEIEKFKKRARRGDCRAMVALGHEYCESKDPFDVGVDQDLQEGVKWYRMAADKKDPIGLHCLGHCYQFADGVEQDYDKARQLYEQSIKRGSVRGMTLLAEMYFRGDGVARDDDQAFFWYKRAALSGDPPAQYQVGYMYCQGRGTDADQELGQRWIAIAAENGDSTARQYLALRSVDWGRVIDFFVDPSGSGGPSNQLDEAAEYYYRQQQIRQDNAARARP